VTRRVTRRKLGTAGFYRTYAKGDDRVSTIDEAVALTIEKAEAKGLLQIEVVDERTGVDSRGYFHVALQGHTQKSLDREAKSKEES
jgi:hypothetical protein